MTRAVTITHHAVDRYLERIDGGLTWHEAEAELQSHERALRVAADFGCKCVRLGNGAGLVLDDNRVVTVVGRAQHRTRARMAA